MNQVVTPDQFDFAWFGLHKIQKRKRGNPKGRGHEKFLDLVTAFDIETTKYIYKQDYDKKKKKHIPRYQSYMYIWAWQFGESYTVIGRTWDEFIQFRNELKKYIPAKTKLMVFVHNLSYEFQFLRGIYNFTSDEVFALDRRKVLKCSMQESFEFRCSYLHTNMNLETFTHKMGAKHAKLSGEDFDYSIERHPWTKLTDEEMSYIINDVLGLVEAITIEMNHDNDNLYSYPLTSTGYVRRDAKQAMRKISHYFVKKQLPDLYLYEMLREAFRGGNTHANRFYAGTIQENVYGADEASAYPAQQCIEQFPVTPFQHIGGTTFDHLMKLINVRHKAVVMRVSMTNVRLRDKYFGCPYLSRDRSRQIRKGAYDNGRILHAEYLETTITDVDLRIILDEYDFDDFVAFDVAYATYGKLPPPLIEVTQEYYNRKTELKDVEGQELLYMKSKNKLNSIYGMMAQDPVKQSVEFRQNDFKKLFDDPEQLITKYNKKAFLAYQWGVWVTAWARYRLEEGIKACGDGFLYCDTDSVYHLGEIDWEEFNKERIQKAIEAGAYATDPQGVTHYMGVFEEDGMYHQFSTLGAKKYVTVKNKGDKPKVTIAGVNKKKGGKELYKHGGIKAFKAGMRFVEAGGTDAFYNDVPEVTERIVDGKTIPITSNVALVDGQYTLGVTSEYEELLNISSKLLDI